jgi:meso-butanediol dehydrogenase / (S,S)-butanediol dehydrogenase / diacetyl reductase
VASRCRRRGQRHTREFTRFVQQFGALHGLVNNAGVLSSSDVPTSTPDEFDRIFGVNVRGMYLCCRAVIPAMIKGAGDRSSTSDRSTPSGAEKLALYTASKDAVLLLAAAIALDHALRDPRQRGLPRLRRRRPQRPTGRMLGGRAELERSLPEFQPIGRPIEPRESQVPSRSCYPMPQAR